MSPSMRCIRCSSPAPPRPGWTTSPPQPRRRRPPTWRAWASPWPTPSPPLRRPPPARLEAPRPLLIGGASLGSQALLEALGNIAQALSNHDKAGSVSLVVPEANSLGVALLGGQPLEAALEALETGQAQALVVLEND